MTAWPAMRFISEPKELEGFARYLRQLGFPHRITEEQGELILWVLDQEHISWVQQQYEAMLAGELSMPETAEKARYLPKLHGIWSQYPITISLIIFSLIGFVAPVLNFLPLVSWLSFQGFSISPSGTELLINNHATWLTLMQQGQWWRLFTPMFLHFSVMHLAFNMVLLWYFGSQLERRKGRLYFINLVLVMSVVSNCAQYLASDALFGGMSGVDYGLIAYCAVANFKHKRSVYIYPQGLFWFALVSMLLGFLGLFSLLGLQLANWAHLAGFASGGLLAALIDRQKHK